ncbi:MAG: HIT family protein [Nitrospira sp.]
MTTMSCPFCNQAALTVVESGQSVFAIRDRAPVTALHTLIITRRHIDNIFDATADELNEAHRLAAICCAAIRAEDSTVDGFNFGSNIGVAAGQTIYHAHLHLIPRRAGDMPPSPARPSEVKR